MATIGDSCIQFSTPDGAVVTEYQDSSPFSVFTPPTSPKAVASGPKHKLMTEGDVQLCRLNHTRTIVSKIMNSKYLRRWENHKVVLDHSEIRSTTPTGFMEQNVPYSSIEDVHIVSRWDIGNNFCIRITVPDGSLLFSANNAYIRDQWMYSIQWKKHIYRYEKLLKNTRRPEVLVKEIKNLIDVSLTTPIQDTSVFQFPLDLISEVLAQTSSETISRAAHENIIIAISPLLENNHPTQEICDFFSLHCKSCPRSSLVMDLFTPIVQRILKHNMDFGKYPRMRTFVQEYLQALKCQNDGTRVVQSFIENMHGPGSTCPHPRVLPNLVAVCLAAIYNLYEDKKTEKEDLTQWNLAESETDGDVENTDNLTIEKICLEFSPMRRRNAFHKINKKLKRSEGAMQDNMLQSVFDTLDWESKLLCFVSMMETMADFTDWRLTLGSLLQPIPFPDDAIADTVFTSNMKRPIQRIAEDKMCDVHQTLLGIREGKEGWFHLYCPGGIACDDDGQLWSIMLETLIRCCCRRKKFLQGMTKMNGPVMLLALRDNVAAMETLCAMLEMEVIDSQDMKMQMITTLQSTTEGKRMYAELCDRQVALRELQQKGGPKKLTLPSKSTDADLAKMLSSGSFGNLECLSLAFTQVTSACAQELIKLPSLRYLNLWSTQFGDAGLELISEHLQKLQVLNLCETPVTDKGLVSLAAMKHLRKLNLNSTSLSALTFEGLKEKLPALQECDVRYTDAW